MISLCLIPGAEDGYGQGADDECTYGVTGGNTGIFL